MKKLILFFIVLFISCAPTRIIMIPAGEFPAYKKAMHVRGEILVGTDTLKSPDGQKILKVKYKD
jgi:hypothetical protein